MGSGKHIPADKVTSIKITVTLLGRWLLQLCSVKCEADAHSSESNFFFIVWQVNLRLILVSGKTKEFLFSPEDSAAEIAQFVFDNWPEGKIILMIFFKTLNGKWCNRIIV